MLGERRAPSLPYQRFGPVFPIVVVGIVADLPMMERLQPKPFWARMQGVRLLVLLVAHRSPPCTNHGSRSLQG